MSQQLTADREDGTLLRAKATPNGMLGYLIGKLISVSGGLLIDLAIVADARRCSWSTGWPRPARHLADAGLGAGAGPGRHPAGRRGARLGVHQRARPGHLTAADPRGDRDLRHLLPDHRAAGLAAGRRPRRSRSTGSAWACARPCSRRTAVAVEIGESWRHLRDRGRARRLGGGRAARSRPVVLRRMARRESGSRVADRRERALQRVG